MGTQAAGLNCTTSPWALKSNPDISGIGILVGFAATAYSTLFLCVAYYLVDSNLLSNPVDQYCIDRFYGLFNKSKPSKQSRPSERWTKTLEGAVLTFSDQQIITGIAILISGYTQLRDGLAVYYWQLVVDLAWFSSVTHLTTLTCLRYYFRERQGLKMLRLICMVVMAGMLSCAIASTRYLGGASVSYDFPAWCLFHSNYKGTDWPAYHNTTYVVLVIVYLFVSYSVRIVQLFPSVVNNSLRYCHDRFSNFAQNRLQDYRYRALNSSFPKYWASIYTLTMAIHCILKATRDLYSSMLWEITWLATALAWGSIRIFMDRDVNFDFQTYDPGYPDDSTDVHIAVVEDNVWGFGQVVAVALLAAPLFIFFESIYESVIMDRKISGPLLTSASKSDRGASSGSSNAEPWTKLYGCAWFRSLVWLLYLMSLATATTVLYVFPLQGDSYDLKNNIASIIQYYAAWFGVDFGMLFLLTIVSLSLFNVEDISQHRWTWLAKMLGKRTERIQRILLIILVLGLTASSAAFGWKTLKTSTFFVDQ